jgi:hypothetical protein
VEAPRRPTARDGNNMTGALLGRDVHSGDDIYISDIARRSGLYVLGKPGMGKSSLLINMALDDVRAGHGLFFLDPHGEAIDSLLFDPSCRDFYDYIDILNPFNDDRTFGINLFACDNLESLQSRTETYTRAYNIFDRLWGDNWGPWLQLGLQNTLKAFIENPAYTLAEVPLFLDRSNTAFRHHIVSNIKREPAVAAFWRQEFSIRRDREQQERIDATLTRVHSLLGHPQIRHLVGQRKTTVDFARSMAESRLVLVEIPASLPKDIRIFVGTILISELLHAIRTRPLNERTQFCIFVDEFQYFATEDFATLMMEARKYGVATTIAHQERSGQLHENPKILGATSAAANRLFFQLSPADANEFAPEFAPFPESTDIHREAVLAPTTRAVEDIWEKGHPEEWIRTLREHFFWIVELLKNKTQEDYVVFAPERGMSSRSDNNDEDLQWRNAEISDWPMYRASTDMLKEAISLLNAYFYDWMHGRYQKGAPATDKERSVFVRLITNLGGIYGIRPAMIAYIPEEVRQHALRRFKDHEEHFVRSAEAFARPRTAGGWNSETEREFARMVDSLGFGTWKLSHIPTILTPQGLRAWEELASAGGLSPHEIEQSVKWQLLEPVGVEERALSEVIYATLKELALGSSVEVEWRKAFVRYTTVMIWVGMCIKHGKTAVEKMSEDEMLAMPSCDHIRRRLVWQTIELYTFIRKIRQAGEYLQKNPLRTATGLYEEKGRLEQTHADIIVRTSQELARLSKYTAYAKITQERNGQQSVLQCQLRTLPLEAEPAGNEEALKRIAVWKLFHLNVQDGYRLRSSIEREISERQRPWIGTPARQDPPPASQKMRPEGSQAKPPPSSYSSRQEG